MSEVMPPALQAFLDELAAADEASCPVEQRRAYADRLGAVMREGERGALVVRLGRPGLPQTVPWLVWPAILACWPYALLLALDPGAGLRGQLFGLSQAVVCFAMLVLAQLGWTVAERHLGSVADLLAASPDRESFAVWLERTQRRPRQVLLAVATALFATLLVYLSFEGRNAPTVPPVVVYVSAAWTGLLGGGVLYWLLCAANAPLHIRHSRRLRLSWLDPAHTPGIVSLCKCYILVAAGAGAGLILIELSALALAPGKNTPLAQFVTYVFPVLAGLLTLHIGAQPFVTLARTVRHYQKDLSAPLLTAIAEPPHSLSHRAELKDVLETYKYFKTLRGLPVRSWVILQYVAGILATLIAYFIQQALK